MRNIWNKYKYQIIIITVAIFVVFISFLSGYNIGVNENRTPIIIETR